MSAVNRLIVVASIQGAAAVAQQITGIGNSASVAARGIGLLRTSIGGLLAGATVAGLLSYVNTFQELRNKLQIVSSSQENLNDLMEELGNIAVRTRGNLEGTVTLYQRMALVGRQTGQSQAETLKITELLGKAITASGAGAQEATAAMIQLSQGMAKGRLDGEELRSVLEQLPYVADLIAKQMGVTRGELRALGADGKITTRIIQDAILNGGAEIEAIYGRMVPTLSQAWQVLRTRVMEFVAEIDRATGFSEAIARSMIWLGENIQEVAMTLTVAAGGLAAFGAALGTARLFSFMTSVQGVTIALQSARGMALQTVIPMTNLSLGLLIVETAFKRATAAAIAFMLSNPFTVIFAALVLLLPVLYAFREQIQISADGTVTLGTVFTAIGDTLSSLVAPALQIVVDLFRVWSSVMGAILGIFSPFYDLVVLLADALGIELNPTVASTRQWIQALGEGIILLMRLALSPLAISLGVLGEIMGAFGIISADALAKIRNATSEFLNFIPALTAASKRIQDAGLATAEAASTITTQGDAAKIAAAETVKLGAANDNTAWGARRLASSTREATDAIFDFEVVSNGWIVSNQRLSGGLQASVDGINAINASAGYYSKSGKIATDVTNDLDSSVRNASSGVDRLGTSLDQSTAKAYSTANALGAVANAARAVVAATEVSARSLSSIMGPTGSNQGSSYPGTGAFGTGPQASGFVPMRPMEDFVDAKGAIARSLAQRFAGMGRFASGGSSDGSGGLQEITGGATVADLQKVLEDYTNRSGLNAASLYPGQQGYGTAQAPTGVNVPLTSSGDVDQSTNNVINVTFSLQGDPNSVRENAAEIESRILAAVSSAQRRIGR